MGAVDGQWRNDYIHARAICQSRVHHGGRLVNAPPNGRDDLVNDVHQVRVVLEHHVAFLKDAGTFDVDLFGAVDQNVVNRRILKQGFERPQSEYFIQYFERETFTFASAERRLQVRYKILNNGEHLGAHVFIAL